MVSFLIILLLISSFFISDKKRRIPIMAFIFEKAFSEMIYHIFIFSGDKDFGLLYYTIMGVLDFLTILVINKRSAITKTSLFLQIVCSLSIVFNLTALILYYYRVSHALYYEYIYILLYIISIIAIIKMSNDGRDGSNNFLHRYFNFSAN